MLKVQDADIYVGGELAVKDVTVNYNDFDMESEEPQQVLVTAFLPYEDEFHVNKSLILDLKDGRYVKVVIISSMRLCDENQCEMRVVDAATSLGELTAIAENEEKRL